MINLLWSTCTRWSDLIIMVPFKFDLWLIYFEVHVQGDQIWLFFSIWRFNEFARSIIERTEYATHCLTQTLKMTQLNDNALQKFGSVYTNMQKKEFKIMKNVQKSSLGYTMVLDLLPENLLLTLVVKLTRWPYAA